MSAHTPGPWKVANLDKLRAVDSDGVSVARSERMDGDYQQRLADTRLIAAAPELLESLEAIVKSLADQDYEGLIEHAEQMIAARSAIAKATGA